MASPGSVAPRERVNIVYTTESGGVRQDKELPLKMLVIGDFTRRPDATPLEERRAASVTKDNFDDVIASQRLHLDFAADNTLADGGGELPVHLRINTLKDFAPEAVARQVPELSKLLELREALNALKGPLGNIPAFRKKIQSMIGDEAIRARILAELGGDR
jgi:type VI secretion system protein ImpB